MRNTMTATLLGRLRRRAADPRLKRRLYFRSASLDLYLQMALSYGAFGGSSVGEALYASSRVEERDLDTWIRAWQELGESAYEYAREAADRGHTDSARQGWLRAYTYLRTATHAVRPGDARFRPLWERAADAFGRAAGLLDPPLERISVPVEGGVLPGYVMRPPGAAGPRPTLLLFGGGETYAQDMYFWGGATGTARGWNVVAVEVPGQGSTAFDGLRFRADVEVAVSRIVDDVLARPDVDPERLAAYGLSLGGYIVMRAAEHDERIRAVAASTPIVDWHRLLVEATPPVLRRFPGLLERATSRLGRFFDPTQLVVFEKFFQWQVGAATLGEALRSFESWKVDVSRIRVPVLAMVGEGEGAPFRRQAREVHQLLPGPTALRSFPASTGADAHSQANHLLLAQEVVFDWLDEAFGVPRATLTTLVPRPAVAEPAAADRRMSPSGRR
ncbi:alpha/beta hydrolase family protein [Geodermatophilus sp. SYSU D00691]